MGRKDEDECEALYCRENAAVSIRTLRGEGKKINLCLTHWFDHCEDRIVELSAGEKLMPVPLISAEEISATTVPRARGISVKP